MLVYAGIDEAGYGPLLGPLCVAAAVFVVSDHDPDVDGAPNLWRQLNAAVCRRPSDARRRIAVDDSKILKAPNNGAAHPLRHLERGVLAFTRAAGIAAEDDAALFDGILAARPAATWYASRSPLPVAVDTGDLRIAAARLGRALDRTGIRVARLAVETIDAGPFNASLRRSGSKARVNIEAVLRHLDAVWRAFPDEHPRVVVDRQGGRIHYREVLQQCWPDASMQVLAESPEISRYRVESGPRRLTVTFLPEAEARHFPVALASMFAKYVRELHMVRLNRFFRTHRPDLRPTAGYTQDGRRFLEDVEDVIRTLGLARRELVRDA